MKRSLIACAALAASAGAAFGQAGTMGGRHFLLAEDDKAAPGLRKSCPETA